MFCILFCNYACARVLVCWCLCLHLHCLCIFTVTYSGKPCVCIMRFACCSMLHIKYTHLFTYLKFISLQGRPPLWHILTQLLLLVLLLLFCCGVHHCGLFFCVLTFVLLVVATLAFTTKKRKQQKLWQPLPFTHKNLAQKR